MLLIQNIKKNYTDYNNRYIFFLIIFAFFIIYQVSNGHFAIEIRYPLLNSYVDYDFGFIKRGLFAEIINLSPLSHTLTLRLMTYAGCFILIIFFVIQYRLYFIQKEYFLPLASMLFAPFFIKNYMYAVGFSDILFFVIFIGMIALPRKITFILLLFYPIMVFIHEAIALFFLPWIMFVFFNRYKDNKTVLYSTNSIMLVGFFISLLCVILYGKPDIPKMALREYLSKKDSFVDLTLNGVVYYYMSYREHIKYNFNSILFNPDHHGNIYFFGFKHILNLLNWYVIYFLAKPVWIASFTTIKVYFQRHSLNMWLIGVFPVSVLMLLLISATDWLRFAGYFIGLMMFTSIYCDKDKFINSYISHINSFSHLKYVIFISTSLMIPAIGTYTHIFRVFF